MDHIRTASTSILDRYVHRTLTDLVEKAIGFIGISWAHRLRPRIMDGVMEVIRRDVTDNMQMVIRFEQMTDQDRLRQRTSLESKIREAHDEIMAAPRVDASGGGNGTHEDKRSQDSSGQLPKNRKRANSDELDEVGDQLREMHEVLNGRKKARLRK